MQEIQFEPDALRKGGKALSEAGQDLTAKFEALASSPPAFGEDDISALCKMVYDAIIDVVRESSGGIGDEWTEQNQRLEGAAKAYEATEQANTQASSGMAV
ncbi:hypothetical protein ACQBAR_00180 [Propionibacteriaceae bacterium Y1685]|uniref:hypothetical protein n=1 Tax=Microlunatus sp. Y1700 TaxID=3418487 RepID=UPI003B7FE2AA